MIISHRLKFAYFRVPKTGSTTMEFLLRLADRLDQDDIMSAAMRGGFPAVNAPDFLLDKRLGRVQPGDLPGLTMHLTPAQAVIDGYITQAQLEEYTVFVCCREPMDRYFSAFKHMYRRMPIRDQFVADIEAANDYGILTKPTVDYAYSNGVLVADLLDFDDYQLELKRMLAVVGADIFPVIPRMNLVVGPLMNDTPTQADYWTPALRATILTKFAADKTLWDGMKAGTL